MRNEDSIFPGSNLSRREPLGYSAATGIFIAARIRIVDPVVYAILRMAQGSGTRIQPVRLKDDGPVVRSGPGFPVAAARYRRIRACSTNARSIAYPEEYGVSGVMTFVVDATRL